MVPVVPTFVNKAKKSGRTAEIIRPCSNYYQVHPVDKNSLHRLSSRVGRIAFAASPTDECVIALNSTASKALNITGSGSVNATSCGIVVDSSSTSALALTGSGNIKTKYTNVVGGYSDTGSGKFSPTPQTGSTVQSDPLTFLTPPSSTECNYTNFSVTAQAQPL